MSVSGVLVALSAYALRWFIRQKGGVEEVGIFSAGWAISNTYVGMIFSAISTDFYPRLAAVNTDNDKCRRVINEQGEIGILILLPLIIICLVCMPFILWIIYSDEFLSANDYIRYVMIGMIFKMISWVIAFQFIAKGESKLFIINETISTVYTLIFNILGYMYLGLEGLGIAFTLGYLVYSIQVFIISRKRYGYSFSLPYIRVIVFSFVFVLISLLSVVILQHPLDYIFGGLLFLGGAGYSFVELNKRMRILDKINTIISR